MHQTILDTYLDLTVKEGLITSEEKTKLKLILFTELFEIGFMESAEENKNEEFLSPDEIIEKVNHYRGARLLGLAFIAVLLLEENKELITNVRNGVSHIGSGLQLMDDISDIKKDTTERKRNYLASYLAGKYSLNYSMLTVEVNSIDFEKKYHADILLAFQKGIEFIKTGLDSLETVGINFSDVEVQELMKFIIRSRNLEESFGGVFNQ
jgi:geranylgeranyl pyrophosphate synthase